MQLLQRILPLLAMLLAAKPLRADYTVVPNKTEHRGTWDGWGCSISWWGKGIGNSDNESLHGDLLFTIGTIPYLDQKLPSLGLNIVRYNIGGGGNGDSPAEKVSPTLPWFKDIDGFWISGDHPESATKSWDWTRDKNQLSMLKAAQKRGVTWIEFFSNSPMWWMNDSQSSDGGKLLLERNADYARYLATVVKYAREKWGIPVRSIEAFNEPSAYWWKYPKQQEGCIIPKEQQSQVLAALAQELKKQGVADIAITASDENSISQAIETYDYFKTQQIDNLITKINVHAYNGLKPWRDNTARKKLRDLVGKKRLWMSEFCDGAGDGMALAQTILEDLTYLKPTAWVYWQPVEPQSAWGLVNADYAKSPDMMERGKPLHVYTKYHVFAQFTRFLRPGAEIIGSDDANTVIANDPAARRIIFITLNYGTAQQISYDLSPLKNIPGNASVTQTKTDGSEKFSTHTIAITNGKLNINATANTIYSISLKGAGL